MEETYQDQTTATGDVLSYRLTEEQLYRALKSRGIFSTQGARAVIQTGLLAVLGAGFLISYLCYDDSAGLFLAIVCAAVIAMIWLVPWFGLRSRARAAVQQKEITVRMTAEAVSVGEGDGRWEIPLDPSSYFWQTDELWMLETSFGRMTVIPKDACEAPQRDGWEAVFRERLSAGPPKRKRRRGAGKTPS